MSFTLFGHWVRTEGRSHENRKHNLLVRFFTLGSSKIKVSEQTLISSLLNIIIEAMQSMC